ncbi:MAG: hypothetical protein SGI92_01915 [Bryobacteraceae bacterium]|nr:hypothetical protein [Bryobacteraceae bacterium]
MIKPALYSLATLALAMAVAPQKAEGALVGAISNNIWTAVGPGIGQFIGGQCNNPGNIAANGCDASAAGLTVNFFNGAQAVFDVGISIRDNGVNTTRAWITITNLLIANPTAAPVVDTLFVITDQFAPSVAGPVGVGIVGAFGQIGGGNIAFAQAQGQMNFLTTPIGGAAAPAGFTLNTVAPFVQNFCCAPVGFWAANFQNDPNGGVQQLIGALQFTLGAGSTASMPGSFIITDNASDVIEAEMPEPGSMALCASALVGAIAVARRRQRNKA